MQYPDRGTLLRTVNEFMTTFTQVSEARKREDHKRLAVPDEDGFVTVSHGPKLNSVAREEEMRELVEKQKKKGEGLEDFYRFQSREKRKERQNQLLRRFDEDKKKLAEIKARKGKIRVSFSLPLGRLVLGSGADFLYSLNDLVHDSMAFWVSLFAGRIKGSRWCPMYM